MFKNRSDIGLPMQAWLSDEDATVGLLLSSFVINVLGLVFPVCVLQFYDRVIPHKSDGTLTMMVCIILAAFALENILKIMRAYVSSWSSARFTYNMGKTLYEHLMRSDLTRLEKNTAGAYLDRFNSAESIKEFYCGQNLIMLVDLPFIVVYVILLVFINKYMAVAPVLFSCLMVFASYSNINKTNDKIKHKTSLSETKDKFLIEMISGIHTIKSLGMEEQFLRRYERLHQKEIANNYDLIQKMAESANSGNLYSQLAIVFSACIGGILVMKQVLTVGGLAASILLIGKIMQPLTRLIAYLEKHNNLEIAKEDLAYILSFKPEYAEGLKKIESINGDLKLTDVSFRYEESDKNILNNINLQINARETVVIHGEQGSGKSSLMLLMAGVLKPSQGSVYIDGNNLNSVDLESYRSHISYMSDHCELFNGSIIDNLTFFDPAHYGEQAKTIAKEIGLHEIIEKMPQAYNTEVGSGTVDLLSKGHKQQIIIARSMLNNPNLILFDEANMALDIDSDVKFRKFLLSRKGKATIVLITHRPSLLEMADKHYKLENGNLVEFKWQ